jgi:probable F420-dependent oxidoreductase
MELGVVLTASDIGFDWPALREFVQAIDAAGFSYVTTNDHVVGGHPDRAGGERVHTYDVPIHEPLTLLSFIAASTGLDVVTSVLLLPQRQTVLVAKQAAALDVLSGGRLRLGVGVGRNWMEYEALNEQFTNRGKRIEEQVEVLRRLWTEELVTFDGAWHHLDRVGINPLPRQRPIPIWMGSFFGNLVEKVLERTGRLADGWMPQFPPGEQLEGALERLRGYASAAGRDPDEIGIECGMRVRDGDDPQTWVDTAAAFRALGATHLRVSTAGGGFATPAEHLDASIRWHDAVASIARD